MRKSPAQLKLSNTYRKDRHASRDISFAGTPITDIQALPSWNQNTKELFSFLTQPILSLNIIYAQDIPTLYQAGEILNDISNLESEKAKALLANVQFDQDKYLKHKMKLIGLYNSLVGKFLVSPSERMKAIVLLNKEEKEKKTNPILDILKD